MDSAHRSDASRSRRAISVAVAIVLVLVVVAGGYLAINSRRGLPAPNSEAFEQTTSRFYRGVAGLQVGLVDAARQDLLQATEVAPGEPAIWANLGLAHLRLGDFDAAGPPLERAAQLAPSSGEIAFLMGRLESARGRREAAIAQFRRAASLDPRNIYARTALIQEVENSGGPGADAEAQRLLEELVAIQPDNPAVLLERARLAAKRGDAAVLTDSVARLEKFAGTWPPEVVERYRALQQAMASGNMSDATRAIAFLRNVLARVPTFRESRRAVTPSAELIAEPFTRFLRLATPTPNPSAADAGLTFTAEAIGESPASPSTVLAAFPLDGESPPAVFAADAARLRRVDAKGPELSIAATPTSSTAPHGLVPLDWNHDFRMDLVTSGADGVRLFLQAADGSFTDETAAASRVSGPIQVDATGAWAADVEMDGDLDIVVGVRNAGAVVLRNNGDGSWQRLTPFADATSVVAFGWGDIDGDGDPDAAFADERGAVQVFANLQAGQFSRTNPPPPGGDVVALTLGDVDADGVLDIVTLDNGGAIKRASLGGNGWSQSELCAWPDTRADANVRGARLVLADLDNNGALDILASRPAGTAFWLADESNAFHGAPIPVSADTWSVTDVTGDGQLDLIGLANGRAIRLTGRGTRGYHYQIVRTRAQSAAGDQRINSFGIGGEVEVRSGRLVQKQTITGPVVHVGLGTRTSVDVARIVWPNGVPQAEFDPAIDRAVVAEQRLKGSCPWVFADNGSGMEFVTDFLWRSPLGLRINAQDTAGVTQTEDWVKIRGDQLKARDGAYDVRITAELWETHFVDHASLLVVDRPNDVEVFVDERFAHEAPALGVRSFRSPQPVTRAWDQHGNDVTRIVQQRDGQYLGQFERGRYQGVAADHFVEFEIVPDVQSSESPWLMAYGFVYPTDSSINVAIGQGRGIEPRGLSLEARDARGQWVTVAPDLGFPAGKNKTVLIDLATAARAGIPGARRFRLRTNLEIYWDSLSYAPAVSGVTLRTSRLAASRADLRYRGFSHTVIGKREEPEIPVYDRLANTAPRWRDLVGYYTRFGDVRELLAGVDDRYVIMNAGDELRLSFAAPPPPPAGWSRDFVLIGDGWEKDGDYNTSYSKTVLPLPSHGHPEYTGSHEMALEADPVYQAHSADWETYHTRFVEPSAFLSGLRFGPAKENHQ
jgi:Tfp pilus assembly protein PilF